MGGRENCEPSPHISTVREHLFLGRHESQPLGTTFYAGPSLHFTLKFKAMDEENKNALPLQMCVGGSYSRVFY